MAIEISWGLPVLMIIIIWRVFHDDIIKWKHFARYWPFVRGIQRSTVNAPHEGQWRGALMFCLICARINGWVNNREAGDLRCHQTHYDSIVLWKNVNLADCHSMYQYYICLSTSMCWILLKTGEDKFPSYRNHIVSWKFLMEYKDLPVLLVQNLYQLVKIVCEYWYPTTQYSPCSR